MEQAPRLSDQVCFALYTASRAVINRYRPRLDELGVTYPQYLALLVLWERGDTTVKELGGALQLDSSTLSPLLKRLEAAGLVRRERRADDERSVLVRLTERGSQLRDRTHDIPAEIGCASGLTGQELADLRATLQRVTASMTGEASDADLVHR